MKYSSRTVFFILAMLLVGTEFKALAAPVTVRFDPSNSVVSPTNIFTVNIVADIPDPILGWGLDLGFDQTVLSLRSFNIGHSWFSATSLDGDNLAGLAFPNAVSGSNTILASLNFMALQQGTSILFSSFTATDLTEGFILETGGFADVAFVRGSVVISDVTTIPEPTTLLLFSLALVSLRVKHFKGRLKKIKLTIHD